MTEEHDTRELENESVEESPISYLGAFEAVGHTSYIEGSAAVAAVEHVGDLAPGEVLLEDSTVVIAVESEDGARQSTALDLSPAGARGLAHLLMRGARSVEEELEE